MPRSRFRLGHALDRYVFGEFVRVFAVTAIGFPVLVFVLDLATNLNKYLGRHIAPSKLALSYVYWLPDTLFNVLPAAVLFASVFTIGAITRYSEITAAKASGISFVRFIRAIFVGATLAMGLDWGVGEVAPRWNAKRLALIKEPRTRTGDGNTRPRFAFAGEDGRVYKARLLTVDSATLTAVEVVRKGNGAEYPGQIVAAASARWRADRGWMLHDGTYHILPDTVTDLAFAFDSLIDRRMTERPRDLMLSPKAPEDMNYAELGRFITAQERSGADVNALRVSRMLKITIPVTCVIILLFGAPLATSTQRGGTAFGIGLSLGTTVIFLVLIQLTRAIGGKGLLPPEAAAWLPSALFGIAGLVMLSRTRT